MNGLSKIIFNTEIANNRSGLIQYTVLLDHRFCGNLTRLTHYYEERTESQDGIVLVSYPLQKCETDKRKEV